MLHCQKHPNSYRQTVRSPGFSLVELMISIIMISIIAAGLGVAMFHTREKKQTYTTSLVSHQMYQNIVRQIARDCRQASLIRLYHTDKAYLIYKDTFPNEIVWYFLDDNNALIKYQIVNSTENYEQLLPAAYQLEIQPQLFTRNDTEYIKNLSITLTTDPCSVDDIYVQTVSPLNHPNWEEVATQSPLN